MFRSLRRLVPIIVVVVLFIALWRANNGDMSSVLESIWTVINNIAQFIVDLWNNFIGSGRAAEILNDTSGSTDGSVSGN